MSKFNPSKVNEIVFDQIKEDLKEGHSNSYIREVYNIGETTLRIVKRCSSFAAYKKFYAERLAQRKAKAATSDGEIDTDLQSQTEETQVLVFIPHHEEMFDKLRVAFAIIFVSLLVLIAYILWCAIC